MLIKSKTLNKNGFRVLIDGRAVPENEPVVVEIYPINGCQLDTLTMLKEEARLTESQMLELEYTIHTFQIWNIIKE